MYKTGSKKSIVFNTVWLVLSLVDVWLLYFINSGFWLGFMASVPVYIFLSLLYDDLKVKYKTK